MIRKQPNLKYLLPLIPGILVDIFLMTSAHRYSEIASRQRPAVGVVTQYEPSNRNRYGYRFQVGGRYYRGWDAPLRAELRIGQSVGIYYDPLDPAESSLVDFAERRYSALGPAITILILSGVFAAVILLFGPEVTTARIDQRPATYSGHVRELPLR